MDVLQNQERVLLERWWSNIEVPKMSAKAKQQRDEWEVKMIGVHQSILEVCGKTPV